MKNDKIVAVVIIVHLPTLSDHWDRHPSPRPGKSIESFTGTVTPLPYISVCRKGKF